ncbi:hypothetical protein PLESTM_000095300 [Pleodorina starrii]|nr:hypothetical protein PLESTM_000095300 [Pleodorina starrii]
MPGGCFAGTVFAEGDSKLVLYTTQDEHWSLEWSPQGLKGFGLLAAGWVVHLEGMCDPSKKPPLAWVTGVRVLSQVRGAGAAEESREGLAGTGAAAARRRLLWSSFSQKPSPPLLVLRPKPTSPTSSPGAPSTPPRSSPPPRALPPPRAPPPPPPALPVAPSSPSPPRRPALRKSPPPPSPSPPSPPTAPPPPNAPPPPKRLQKLSSPPPPAPSPLPLPPPPPPVKSSPPPRPPPPSPPPPPPSPPPPPPPVGVAPLPRDVYVMRSVVFSVDMCGQESSADAALIQELWSKALPKYFESASFGAMSMPPEYNKVVPEHVTVGCGGWTKTGSRWSINVTDNNNLRTWGDIVDSNALKTLGLPVDGFFHRVYLLPPSVGSTSFGHINCPLSYDGVVRVWTGVAAPAARMFRLFAHELGHNLGLLHSQGYDSTGTVVNEYGDMSCPMAVLTDEPPIHYNAAQSVQLGWTQPQAVLRANDLVAGTWYSYRLRGVADSQVSSLQFFPATWMGSGWGDGDKLYVSFRRYTPTNGDAGLSLEFRNKVQVHRHAAGCSPTVLVATLGDGGSASGPSEWPNRSSNAPAHALSPLLVVRVTRIDAAAGTATVAICRASQFSREFGAQCRDGLDNDCDGKIDNC